MRIAWACLFLVGCGGDHVGVSANFVLPQAFRSSDIKSYEIYVVTKASLPDNGAQVCEKFFADEIPELPATSGHTITAFDSTGGVSSTTAIKVPPGQGYVVLAQGWNVDLAADPNAASRRVIAVGCVPNVVIRGSQTTDVTLALCVCATPMAGDSSTACRSPLCPSL